MTTNDSVQMRACVLREPGTVATETVSLAAPRAGEVRVRIAAAGVCHSDLHLADGKLGDGRWPIVLGHEGAGVVDAVGEGVDASDARRSRRAGDGRPLRAVRVLPGRSPHVVRAGRRPRVRGGAGRRQLASDRRRRSAGCSTASASPASPSTRSSPSRPRSRSRPELPLWQASLLGLRCGDRIRRRQPCRPGRDRRARLRGRLRRRRDAGDRGRAAGRRGPDHRRRPARREARPRDASGGHPHGARRRRRSRRPRSARCRAAVSTTRSRWSARRRRSGWRGTRCAPAAPRSSSASRPVGVEVGLPAIEFLSEKRIVGSYYGSADPALSLRGLVDLASAGRLPLDDMVSHFIELDQIPEAFERLRRGEGNRSVSSSIPSSPACPTTQRPPDSSASRRSPTVSPSVHLRLRRPDRRGLERHRPRRRPRQRRARRARNRDRGGAADDVHLPRPGSRPDPRRRRRGQGPLRAGLAADDHDQQGDRARAPPSEDHLGRRPARDRPGGARRGRRGPDPVQR